MSRDIQVNLIDPDPNQPRQHFDEAKLNELAQSMASNGLAVPISVRPNGDERFTIVHGERRYRAALTLGWETIRAEVRDVSSEEAFKLALIENVQRDNLSPIEEARAYQKLQAEGMNQMTIGELVGKSQQYIADRLSLLKLPDEVQGMVTARAVNPSIARRLVSLDDAKSQAKLAKRAAKENLTVKDIEREKQEIHRRRLSELDRLELFAELVKAVPELGCYEGAVKNGEIDVGTYNWWVRDGEMYTPGPALVVKTTEREFTGQTWHWPKYTGARSVEFTMRSGHPMPLEKEEDKTLSIPVFSEQEWQEWADLDERELLDSLEFPGCEWFNVWPTSNRIRHACSIARRTYDPIYGRFIANNDDRDHCDVCPSGPMFIKQGWGKWRVVEFNDGNGSRTRRRYFAHDHIGHTLVQQAVDTIDPFSFSHHNFGSMKLWQLQPHQMSWFYIRRKTISREEAIAAIEEDLERLRNVKELSEDEFTESVLDWLQGYIPDRNHWGDWREGVITLPRKDDGSIDQELLNHFQ